MYIYTSIIKFINKKNKMYKKIIKHKTTEKFNYYMKYKNILTSILRKSEYILFI